MHGQSWCTYLHGMVDALIHVLSPVGVAVSGELDRKDSAVEMQLTRRARLAGDG